jgi:Xaa-Pro dipeptidase
MHKAVNYIDRQSRLAEILENANLDAIALNASPSLTYLTGMHFHLSERPVLGFFSSDASVVIVLPELESGKISSLNYPIQAFPYQEDPQSWQKVTQNALQALGLTGKRIGFEPRQARMLEIELLKGADPDLELHAGDACTTQLRISKDEVEIANMRQSVEMAEKAIQSVLPGIKPGVKERELAAEVTIALLREGSDSQLPFAPIVASGPNSANPHAFASQRSLEPGDLLIIDWGASFEGYFSDLTRTFAFGEPDPELMEVANVVQEANRMARTKAGPGVSAQDVDRTARKVIEDAGYGQYFIHRTGHGLGMEGHEPPYIREGNKLILSPGMAFTIEPGVYIQGKGGIRIEDDVVITEQGCESLSDFSRALRILDV